MTDGKKRSIWSRLLGVKRSSCCDVRIDEVTKEQINETEEQTKKTEDNGRTGQTPCCCGRGPKKKT